MARSRRDRGDYILGCTVNAQYFADAGVREREKEPSRLGRPCAYLEVEERRSPKGHLPIYRVAETTAGGFAEALCVYYFCVFLFLSACATSGKLLLLTLSGSGS